LPLFVNSMLAMCDTDVMNCVTETESEWNVRVHFFAYTLVACAQLKSLWFFFL